MKNFKEFHEENRLPPINITNESTDECLFCLNEFSAYDNFIQCEKCSFAEMHYRSCPSCHYDYKQKMKDNLKCPSCQADGKFLKLVKKQFICKEILFAATATDPHETFAQKN